MNYAIEILPVADEDLRGIFAYWANELLAHEEAKALLNNIMKAVMGLQTLPERYPKHAMASLPESNIRRMPVGKFLVFYDVDKTLRRVTVLRVIYGTRDVEQIF